MKISVVIGIGCLIFITSVSAQNEEFVVFSDFETEIGEWSGWASVADFTAPNEPHHGGQSAAKVEVVQDQGWTDARFRIPEGIDATGTDEFRLWVYSDKIFRLRVDLGVEVILGFRNYGPEDVGKWKEFIFWYPEEKGKLWEVMLSSVRELRMWINPDPDTIDGVEYPGTFEGTVYFDDMVVRKRKPVEREYLPLIGFNEKSEADLVSLASGGTGFSVDLSVNPEPTEGKGCLQFFFVSSWTENFVINLKKYPPIRNYDRIHFDLFVEGSSADWAAFTPVLKVSWTDPDENARGTGWTDLDENIIGEAVGNWREISGQYGPLNDLGYTRNWLLPEIAGVFDDPNGTITLTFATQGADGLNGVNAYLDNIRLSRPKGSSVMDWELR